MKIKTSRVAIRDAVNFLLYDTDIDEAIEDASRRQGVSFENLSEDLIELAEIITGVTQHKLDLPKGSPGLTSASIVGRYKDADPSDPNTYL